MAESIKFNNTELVNATYILRNINVDSFSREINSVKKVSDDGENFVEAIIRPKVVAVKGTLVGTSAADLQTKMDAMKALFAGKEKNLDITPNGGSLRRYVATCSKLEFLKDYYHILHCPYEAELSILSGIGKATATTELLNTTRSADYSAALTITVGSADQKPIIDFIFITAAAISGIKIRNYNTTEDFDDNIIITESFSDSDTLQIDCDAKTVKKNGVEVPYYGKFPRFIVGVNNVSITFAQIVIEQNPAESSLAANVYDVNWIAQSFRVKHTDTTYRTLMTALQKVGTPPADLTITIEGDNNGKPDGTPIATFTVAPADVTTGLGFITKDNATNFTLNGNTPYWIVFKMTGGDNSNKFQVFAEDTDSYAKGNRATSADGGTTWTNDYTKDVIFYLYFGGKPSGAYNIAVGITYYPRYL